jgi:hypothetical protein
VDHGSQDAATHTLRELFHRPLRPLIRTARSNATIRNRNMALNRLQRFLTATTT